MNKRIRQIIDYYSLSTRQFEQKISVSNGVIAKVLAQNTTLRSDILSKIADTFPEVNMGWLLTGKGEMLRSEAPMEASLKAESDKIWKEILADKDRRIEELIIENYQIREQIAHIQAITPPLRNGLTKTELQDGSSDQPDTSNFPTPETLLTYSPQQLVSLAISQQETIASLSETIDRLTSKK